MLRRLPWRVATPATAAVVTLLAAANAVAVAAFAKNWSGERMPQIVYYAAGAGARSASAWILRVKGRARANWRKRFRGGGAAAVVAATQSRGLKSIFLTPRAVERRRRRLFVPSWQWQVQINSFEDQAKEQLEEKVKEEIRHPTVNSERTP